MGQQFGCPDLEYAHQLCGRWRDEFRVGAFVAGQFAATILPREPTLNQRLVGIISPSWSESDTHVPASRASLLCRWQTPPVRSPVPPRRPSIEARCSAVSFRVIGAVHPYLGDYLLHA